LLFSHTLFQSRRQVSNFPPHPYFSTPRSVTEKNCPTLFRPLKPTRFPPFLNAFWTTIHGFTGSCRCPPVFLRWNCSFFLRAFFSKPLTRFLVRATRTTSLFPHSRTYPIGPISTESSKGVCVTSLAFFFDWRESGTGRYGQSPTFISLGHFVRHLQSPQKSGLRETVFPLLIHTSGLACRTVRCPCSRENRLSSSPNKINNLVWIFL